MEKEEFHTNVLYKYNMLINLPISYHSASGVELNQKKFLRGKWKEMQQL